MGKAGSIIWLAIAALAAVYLIALTVYALIKRPSARAAAAPPPPPSPSPAPTAKSGEITENVSLKSGRQNPAVECGDLAAGFMSLVGGRKYQEDSLHVGMTAGGALMAVVCDGMGGLEGGAAASAMAVKQLTAYARDFPASGNIPELLRQAAVDTDLDVADMRGANAGRSGTTAVAALVFGGTLHWLSVGDSRIYVLRGSTLHQITRDHNYELELRYAVEAGTITAQEAMQANRPDALISYLGMGGVALADTGTIELEGGDSVLLCSDGLFKALSETEIAQMISSFGPNVTGCADALVTSAVRRGGARQDNTTAIVIHRRIY